MLVSTVDGKKLNSPNDLVVKSDDTIWFTDPTYGIDSEYEGDAAPSEIGESHVYRYDPVSGQVHAVARDFVKPNGIAFSPDESLLYVADTGATPPGGRSQAHPGLPGRCRWGFARRRGGCSRPATSGSSTAFAATATATCGPRPGDGVHCYAPDGTLLGKIKVPEVVANLCFGGRKGNRLYICGTTSLYAMYVNAHGATWPARK